MNTDRELLELAAKAAGIKALRCPNGVLRDCTGLHPAMNIFSAPEWNPLTDDGDAFSLMVRLRLSLRRDVLDVGAFLRVREMNCGELGVAMLKDDPYAATRRAIVRAAAEIGRSKT